MKKIFLAIIASLITFSTVWAQTGSTTDSNQPGPKVEMSAEMKAYVDHLMGLDKPKTARKAVRKVCASSWSYPESTPATPFGGGTGTEADPYLISTPQQLANLAYMVNNGNTYSGKYFKMTDDIVLNSNVLDEDGSLNSGTFQSWTPIGGYCDSRSTGTSQQNPFKGYFDGNGHYVSGIYFSNANYQQVGLFGAIQNATIERLGIIDSYLYSYRETGGIVGYANFSSINYCYNKSTIISESFIAGGIVGRAGSENGDNIIGCYNSGRITTLYGNSASGIIGLISNSSISYCYNTGTITSEETYASGIGGGDATNGSISNCYNLGTISQGSTNRTFYGSISHCSSDITSNCYYLEGTCTALGNTYGISKSSSAFSDGTVLSLIDPSGTYFMQGANGYPVLKGVGEGANRLYVDDFKLLPNTATTVSVNMWNTNAISGFQFDLVLPSGVTLNSVTRSSARTSYTYNITQKAQADGSIRIVCIASGAAAAKFTGTDGEVLKLSLTSTGTGDKTITLKNQILTESDLDEVSGVESTASMHVHNVTAHSATAATCTATGNSAYWYCSGCSKYFSNSACTTETTLADATIAALGHNYGSATWTWTGTSAATVSKTCSRNSGHVISATATITSAVTTAATCTTAGVRTYTATATLNGSTLTDTKTESIAALGHNYGSVSWTWTGTSAATASKTCSRNSGHVLSATATITDAVTTAATCTDAGVRTYTASATLDGASVTDTKTESIAALGHNLTTINNGNGTHTTSCSQCDYSVTEEHTFVGGVCSVCGANEADVDTDISQYDNVIYISNRYVHAGSRASIPIRMKNISGITAFSFVLTLPEGITLAKDENGENIVSLDSGRKSSTHLITSNSENDNTINVACLSGGNDTFSGNDGAIVYVTVEVNKDMSLGNYPVILNNIIMATPNNEKYSVPAVQSTLTVASFLPGDVDDDGTITIVDAVGVINFVIKANTTGLNENAADADQDGSITIVDAVYIINQVIHANVNNSKSIKFNSKDSVTSSLRMQDVYAGAKLYFNMPIVMSGNSNEITATQFVLNLPKGIELECAYTDEKHLVVYQNQDDGSIRMASVSLDNSTFSGNGDVAITLNLNKDPNFVDGEISIKDAIITTPSFASKSVSSTSAFIYGNTTSINNLGNDNNTSVIYDLSGRKAIKANRGVYIVNNKKTYIK